MVPAEFCLNEGITAFSLLFLVNPPPASFPENWSLSLVVPHFCYKQTFDMKRKMTINPSSHLHFDS